MKQHKDRFGLFLVMVLGLFIDVISTDAEASKKTGRSRVKLSSWTAIPDDANPFKDWPTPPETFVVGDERVGMSAKQLKDREHAMIVAQVFVILRRPAMVNSADDVLVDYWDTIKSAGEKYDIDPWTIAGILWLESQGNPNAQSPTGPRGVMQFAAGTARDMGLVVENCLTTVKRKKKTSTVKKKGCVAVDERLDPEKSIFAAAKLLSQLHDRYGNMDYAIAAYHMGQGAMDSLVKTYLSPNYDDSISIKENIAQAVIMVGGKKQTGIFYSDIFFRNTPYRNPATFEKIAEINARDFGPTYFYRATCAKILLQFAKESPKKFAKLAGKQKRYDGKPAKYRFTSWYSPWTISQYKSLNNLKDAKRDGEVESVASGLEGCKLLLKGKNPIAEKDLKNQSSYAVLKPAANSVLHAMCATWSELGGSVEPYATSLLRTVAYQKKLKKTNSNARTALPMHTTGLAFDLWKFAEYKKGTKGLVIVNYTTSEKRDILFVLKEYEQIGYISFTDTEPGCWHVVISPDITSEAI